MKLKDFQELINRTIFCAGGGLTEALRPNRKMPEVYIEKSGGNLIMAATNNRRLGYAIRSAGDDFLDFEGILVPAAVLQKIAKRKRDTVPLSISVAGKEVNFHIGHACITTTALAGKFIQFFREPKEYPLRFPYSFTVDRLSLIEAIGFVSVMAEAWCPGLCLGLSPQVLTLRTGDDDSSAEDEISCDFTGENAELVFHVKFFTEIIERINTERVRIRFDTQKAVVVILPEPELDYYYFLAQRKRG